MKGLNLSGFDLGLSFRYLLRRDQGLRENGIVVVPLKGSKKDVDRKIVRPGHPLPNVKTFKIKLGAGDGLFSLAGLTKRTQPKLMFYSGKNASMNRYVDYMFKRLRKQVENKLYAKALKTVGILMRSTSYQIVAYNHVCHNWFRNKPLGLVKQQLKHVDALARKKSYKIEFHRAYIPKGNTGRPLGVPSVPGRVYLHMLNNIIVEWRMVTEGENQHGFIPGRGILTAGKRLFKLLKYPYVYEIDYEKFFDSVRLAGLSLQMVNMGFPEKFALFIEKINKFPIDLEYAKLDEMNALAKIFSYTKENPEFKYTRMSEAVKLAAVYSRVLKGEEFLFWAANKKSAPNSNLRDLLAKFNAENNPTILNFQETTSTILKDRKPYNELSIEEKVKVYYGFPSEYGVAQGAPTSCSLATLALRFIEERVRTLGLEMVAYADDVLLAGPVEFDPKSILEDHNLGLKVNGNKSGGVKYDGVWRGTGAYTMKDNKTNERGLKFLGIRYYPSLGVMVSDYLRGYFDPVQSRQYNIQPFRLVDILKNFRVRNGYLEFLRSEGHAETKNGARLKLTLKISFLAYLAKARDLAIKYINSPYVKQYATIGDGLRDCDKKWTVLSDQVKSISNSPIYGGIVSRMQNDSWTREGDTLQNFQGRATRLSGSSLRGKAYKKENLLRGNLTIFTGSSFACNDLANGLKQYKATKSR